MVRRLCHSHRDGHPLVALPLTEPSHPPPPSGAIVFAMQRHVDHYKTNVRSNKNCATWLSLEGGGGGADLSVAEMCLSISLHACILIGVTEHLGVRLPASPPPRALDNEELFVIEG